MMTKERIKSGRAGEIRCEQPAAGRPGVGFMRGVSATRSVSPQERDGTIPLSDAGGRPMAASSLIWRTTENGGSDEPIVAVIPLAFHSCRSPGSAARSKTTQPGTSE